MAMDNARFELSSLKDSISFAADPYDAANKADAAVFMTEWPEFLNLNFEKLRQLMKTPVIIDGRNMLQEAGVEKVGFCYTGVGRGDNRKLPPAAVLKN
jgi:UDPglucose 6-dehydrogenase